MSGNAYTHMHDDELPEYDAVVCNDCGAHAKTEVGVQHWETCKPGESAYWEAHYEAAYEEEEAEKKDALRRLLRRLAGKE